MTAGSVGVRYTRGAALHRLAGLLGLPGLIGAALALSACGDDQTAPKTTHDPPSQAGTPAATTFPGTTAATKATSTTVPAAPEPFPWEPIAEVRGELGRALAQGDWAAVTARVTAGVSVMRYPSGSDLQELVTDQLVAWLRDRWAPNVTVEDALFVAHFPSLEVPTTGWRPVAPTGATIHFVHHVNPDTRRWFLDVVQYE